jgi:prophage regulatory protein
MTEPAEKPRRILRLKHVIEITGLGRTSIYDLMAAGKFPRNKSIAGTNACGWDSRVVEAWLTEQLDGRRV